MALKRTVLVVEDNAINRGILAGILSEQYTVLEAENGLAALALLQQHGSDIALILLDMMMPVMDGCTFLAHLRKDEELALIPVIVTTQSDSEKDEEAALRHGATDFVRKPYRAQIIRQRVANLIHLRENAAMINQLRYDRLTGVYSKEYFCHLLRRELTAHPDCAHTVICADIEDFKVFNDVFGTAEGDRVLQRVAEMFRELTEREGICGRLGGDQFILLWNHALTEADCRRLVQAGGEASTEGKNAVIRWGIYEVTDPTVSTEQMCSRAVLAANNAKGHYRRYYAIYDEALRAKILREKIITGSVEAALQEEQFTLYYQPKFGLRDDRIGGAEALVRWTHPRLGFLSPGEFIPLFEKNGFITRLDRYVWEHACAQLQDWKQRGLPLVPVSVNVSRADLYEPDLAEVLAWLLEKYDLEPALLPLEITESAYTEHPEQIISAVDKLRELGFVIEMDDFGSGYSSLSMLNRMKLDVLKLDMDFIRSEAAKPAEQGILRFIVELARQLNLRVVAEGVETRRQLEHVRRIGCDYVQGYFFAKPMPAEEFEGYLTRPAADEAEARQVLPPPELPCILVADEDAAYRRQVCDTFRGIYRVLEAADARAALQDITAHEKDDTFAVLLSMTLPEEGAAEVLNFIQESPSAWRVPVLATLPQSEELEEKALGLLANDFLRKPHTQGGLRKRVTQLLDINAQQDRERLLQDEAGRDYLTGLLNRRGFYAAVDALRQDDMPVALYLFDLDDLKRVNDTYGHGKGDEVLAAFGEILRRMTRGGDILCRYGGDEFIVVLRRVREKRDACRRGDEICAALREVCLPDGSPMGCSAGAVLCGPHEKPSAALIGRADRALYKSKHAGKGACHVWEE